MERAAVLGRLTWRTAEVSKLIEENPTTKTIALSCPEWPGHLPGQHVDVRLTASDGYQAQRSYSIANPEDGELVAITVEEIESGEVSPYLTHELAIRDQLEIRGPIGGYFVWTPDRGGPLQLVAGGSGLVPLMAMVRAKAHSGSDVPVRLLTSARSWEAMIYRDELTCLASDVKNFQVSQTLTRAQPPGWSGYSRRVDRRMLEETTWPAADKPQVFVCGPTGFVEAVAQSLVEMGHEPQKVKTERFGPSGG
ncbi:ferredoxin reductase [soil metagenome]